MVSGPSGRIRSASTLGMGSSFIVMPFLRPAFSFTTAATARTVTLPYSARTPSLLPNLLLARLTARMARGEWPPTPEKPPSAPSVGKDSTSPKRSVTNRSVGVRGQTCPSIHVHVISISGASGAGGSEHAPLTPR